MRHSEFLRRKRTSIISDLNEIDVMLKHGQQLNLSAPEKQELTAEQDDLTEQKRETEFALRRARRAESGTKRICACGVGHTNNDQCTF